MFNVLTFNGGVLNGLEIQERVVNFASPRPRIVSPSTSLLLMRKPYIFPIISHEKNVKSSLVVASTTLVDDPVALVDDTTALAGGSVTNEKPKPMKFGRATIIFKQTSSKPKGIKA